MPKTGFNSGMEVVRDAEAYLNQVEQYQQEISRLSTELVTSSDADQSVIAYARLLTILAEQPSLEQQHAILQMLEANLVRREIGRRGAEHGGAVLTPRQERMIENIILGHQESDGIGVTILFGPPGTGKTMLALLLAQRLQAKKEGSPQLVQLLNANSMKPLTDEFVGLTVDPATTRYFYETLAEMFDQRSLGLGDVIMLILKNAVLPYIAHTADKGQSAIYSLLQDIGIDQAISWQNGTISISDGQGESVHNKVRRFIERQAQSEKMLKAKGVVPGPVLEVFLHGGAIIIDEFARAGSMMGPGAMGGIEGVLEPKDTSLNKLHYLEAMLHGVLLSFPKDTVIIGATNDYYEVPEQIRRRFQKTELRPSASDLVFIARTLLSDENGDSILQKQGRADTEHKLCIYLQFWTRLSHQNSKAFSTEALVQLCNRLRKGEEIENVLQSLLRSAETLHALFDRLKLPFVIAPQAGQPRLTLAAVNTLAILRDLTTDLHTSAMTTEQAKALIGKSIPIGPLALELDQRKLLAGRLGLNINGIPVTRQSGMKIPPVEGSTETQQATNTRFALSPSGDVLLTISQTRDGVMVQSVDLLLGAPIGQKDLLSNREYPKSSFSITGQAHDTIWVSDQTALHVAAESQDSLITTFKIYRFDRLREEKKVDGSTHERTFLAPELWYEFELEKNAESGQKTIKSLTLSAQGMLTVNYSDGGTEVIQISLRRTDSDPIRPIPQHS